MSSGVNISPLRYIWVKPPPPPHPPLPPFAYIFPFPIPPPPFRLPLSPPACPRAPGVLKPQNATVKTVKGNIRSSVGDGNTRSIHATIAILAKGGFIDACLPRADGEVPAEKMDRKNCHALAAMVQFVQWPNRDMDEAEGESSYVPVWFQPRIYPGVETRLKNVLVSSVARLQYVLSLHWGSDGLSVSL